MERERNHLGESIAATNTKEQYGDAVKQILSDKQVLAWILQWTTSEFNKMTPQEIEPYIDDPGISTIAADPGLTNDRITGLPQESKVLGEGVLYYDVRFFARVPDSQERRGVRIIVDVEAQKEPNPRYDLVTRGILYGGRMLSEQKGRNVTGRNYDKLEKVYSIWLCFSCSREVANTISSYGIRHSSIYETFHDTARSDLMRVVVVRLPKEEALHKCANAPSELHQLLYDIFVSREIAQIKLQTLREKYQMTKVLWMPCTIG